MNEIIFAIGSSLWFGILTSISPCPLATNIAAVSYLSKRIAHLKKVILASLAYTFGRMFAYTILGIFLIHSLLSIPMVAQILQAYLNKALGPILFIVGLFLLDIIKINISSFSLSNEKIEYLANSGAIGSFGLGVIFALSFCPISAALFFGSLIPLSLQNRFGSILPLFYGLGTALPVLFFAVAIAFGLKSLTKWFKRINRVEYFARKITGIIFVLAGLYYLWAYIGRNIIK
ncbi:MAG: aromatic aminobenezylarsenical efflux permease ArsG family transporter [bacterium]